ncbi:MAG: hypothetical protein KDD40_01085 [Bdellovibrionales bacterium]|nr:hypothetical protein [Bdellovibrionales bacterium]
MATLFICIHDSFALEPISWSETKKSAEQELLNKNRAQAIKIIQDYIASTSTKAHVVEAEEFLSYISQLFLTEEAHKNYYLSRSLLVTDPERAKEKLLFTLGLEPYNERVAVELSRLYLQQEDCKSANELSQKFYTQNPKGKDVSIILLQSLYCLKDWNNFNKIYANMLKLSTLDKLSKIVIEILNLKQNPQEPNLEAKLTQLQALDANFPLTYYWQTKHLLKVAKDPKQTAQRYLSVCQNLKATVVKRYENYPTICSFTAEISALSKQD